MAVIAAVLLVAGSAGCSDGARSNVAAIEVDAATAPADQPVHIRVTGLAARNEVTVSAAATDHAGVRWQSHGAFRADARGVVELDSAAPLSGSYQGADGMGLFWSMDPPTGDPDQDYFVPPPPDTQSSYQVQLTVTANGHRLAERTLTRQWLAPGVSAKALVPATDKVSGELFLPPARSPSRPPVLLFGGSEGGNATKYAAALLASHGHPALALAYFALPGLPSSLTDIPLEYFITAARLLAAQPGADPAHLAVLGYSRGSEAALLLAQDYPTLIHGAVVYAPSARVGPGAGGVAWTKDGQPIPQNVIMLGQVSGPVLAVAGADDHVWPSLASARQINQELDAAHAPQPHQPLLYPNSGHGVGLNPYLAAGTSFVNPSSGHLDHLGGTRAGDAAAKADGWPKVLSFLNF